MSVTIVTSVPAPTQSATSGSASNSDAAASAPDFLSLLIGQLTPVAPGSGAEAETTSDQSASEDPAANADALIAALGITPSIQVSHGDASASQTATGEIDTGLATTSAPAAPKTDNTGTNLALSGTDEPDISVQNGQLSKTPVDDKAAKFAVSTSAALAVENTLTKTSSVDTSPNNASALGNVNANLNTLHRHNDTSASIPTPIRDQSWASDFGQKIVWLAANDKQSAQITLNPAQMGPIEISLNVDKGNATASFVSVNADVREAIESALPRLREMFASAGIELGQTNVSAESFKQQADSESRGTARAGADNAILAAESTGTVSVSAFATQRGNGMVDLFA